MMTHAGSDFWDAQDHGIGTKPWEYIKRGLKEESELTDKEIMAVIDEMKKAVNIIHNDHLNPEKEKKYGWLERKYAAERKWRNMQKMLSRQYEMLLILPMMQSEHRLNGVEVDGKKYAIISSNSPNPQKQGHFIWQIKLHGRRRIP